MLPVQYIQILTFIYVKLMKVGTKNNLIVSKVYPPFTPQFPKFAGFQGPVSLLVFFPVFWCAQQKGTCEIHPCYGVFRHSFFLEDAF